MKTNKYRAGRKTADDGFSLIEVMVSMALLALLIVTVLPSVVAGIKANDASRLSTQMKAIASAETELLRNLPFQVNPSAGSFIDLFDRYYTNLTAPAAAPSCTNSDGEFIALRTQNAGYVSPTASRCSWEPAGAMYRKIRTGADNSDLAGFTVVINTQFITAATPPTVVTPPSTYNTQIQGRDRPAASQVKIYVSVFPTNSSVRTPVATTTQISRTYQAPTKLVGVVEATALEVSTFARNAIPVSSTAGLLAVNSTVTSASVINTVLSSVAASTGTGIRGVGAQAAASAPPSTSIVGTTQSSGSLDATGCDFVCWGGSSISSASLSSTNGLPNAGSPTAPLESYIRTPATGFAFRFTPGPNIQYINARRITDGLIRLKQSGVGMATSSTCTVNTAGGVSARIGSTGWFNTTSEDDLTNPLRSQACATSRTAPISVMLTDFAPDGIIKLTLNSLSARCNVAGPAHTATTSYDYSVTVERWTPTGYVTVGTITPSTTTNVLGNVNLATTPVGTYGVLGDWIDSWSSIVPSDVTTVSTAGRSQVRVPATVTILTQPLRYRTDTAGDLINNALGLPQVDPLSTMSISLGSVQCSIKDAR